MHIFFFTKSEALVINYNKFISKLLIITLIHIKSWCIVAAYFVIFIDLHNVAYHSTKVARLIHGCMVANALKLYKTWEM